MFDRAEMTSGAESRLSADAPSRADDVSPVADPLVADAFEGHPFAADQPADDASDIWADECDESDWLDAELPPAEAVPVSAEIFLGWALDDAVATQVVLNMQAARQLFAITRAFRTARANPLIYVPAAAAERIPGVQDVDFAERSVAFDLAQRLKLSENMVRDLAYQGDVLDTSLPRLRALFVSGAISQAHVRAAVDACNGLPDDAATAAYDEKLAAVATSVPVGQFRSRCRRLRERLCAETLQERHDRAAKLRRVVVEPAEDGMAWLHAFAPLVDIVRADARLTATAQSMKHREGETRTRDQLKADALLAWLTGDGTPSAATAHPTVIVDDGGRFAELLGYGPIPPNAAARALRDAPAFRKVIADPIRPARLKLDTTRYRPTAEQRHWLTLRYGLDDAAAPYVAPGLTTGGEVDHVAEWQHGGTTDVDNLLPLKPRLHRLKSVTRIRLDPKPDGGIRVRTPTGYDSDPPPF
ncbi:HNH endonuclease signature motif containing protein [Humibacter albus]|uniref:HNH endonuclease signature motif containing protein n=1 Tax=Humibacter albus TaxID=427754 RepID=UPI001B7FCE72|nr:HNH endonuclease signature motif containing protein [Humibacter albus]